MTDDGENYKYEYDAFYRLRKVCLRVLRGAHPRTCAGSVPSESIVTRFIGEGSVIS